MLGSENIGVVTVTLSDSLRCRKDHVASIKVNDMIYFTSLNVTNRIHANHVNYLPIYIYINCLENFEEIRNYQRDRLQSKDS